MYAGHIGFALGAKGIRQSIPLWILVVASQVPDWTDAIFCLAGIRTPVFGMLSHSLPAAGILAAAAALCYYGSARDWTGAALVACVVASHVVGDYVTGLKPTWPGGPLIGLQLYRQPMLDFVVEAAVITGGWHLYRGSFPRDRRSSPRVTLILVTLLALQLAADIAFALAPGLKKC